MQELQFGSAFLPNGSYILVLSLFELEYKKSSTGSFRDQLTPLNYIHLRSELNTAVWGCLELWQLGDGKRQKERDWFCMSLKHPATICQHDFQNGLKYSKLREFPCSWVGVDRLSDSIRKRQRNADVYIAFSSNDSLPFSSISPLEESVCCEGCMCLCVCPSFAFAYAEGIISPLTRGKTNPKDTNAPKVT